MKKVELTKEIEEKVNELNELVSKYMFEKYPNNDKINEEDLNVKLYRALGFLCEYDYFN